MDIDDLNTTSIADMSVEEGLELLRQIRLSRRTPKKSSKKKSSSSSSKKAKKQQPELTPEQAAKLLELLGEDI